MIQKLKNRFIKKLGGVTQEEITKAKHIEWISNGLERRRTCIPVEIKTRTTWDVSFAPPDAMESYIKHELFEQIKPFIRIERDPRVEGITAKIMLLPYEEDVNDTN